MLPAWSTIIAPVQNGFSCASPNRLHAVYLLDRFMDMNNASSPRMPEIKNLVPTSSGGHAPAGAKADAKLTFHADNQAGAGQKGTVMAHFTRRSVLRGSLGVAAPLRR